MKIVHYIPMVIALLFFAVGAFAQGDVVVHTDPRLAVLLKKNHTALQASSIKPPHKTVSTHERLADATTIHPAADVAGHTAMPAAPHTAATPATAHAVTPVSTRVVLDASGPAGNPKTPIQADGEKSLRRWVPVHTGGRVVYSGKGFRVQVYNGQDRGKAMDIKYQCMHQFPGVRTYITYRAPTFRVKLGDYRRREEAENMLREARSVNSPCMIVPDMITVCAY